MQFRERKALGALSLGSHICFVLDDIDAQVSTGHLDTSVKQGLTLVVPEKSLCHLKEVPANILLKWAETENSSYKIRNEMRIFTPMIPVQYITQAFSQSNQRKERNNVHTIRKEEAKYSLFKDDLFLYNEGPKLHYKSLAAK